MKVQKKQLKRSLVDVIFDGVNPCSLHKDLEAAGIENFALRLLSGSHDLFIL